MISYSRFFTFDRARKGHTKSAWWLEVAASERICQSLHCCPEVVLLLAGLGLAPAICPCSLSTHIWEQQVYFKPIDFPNLSFNTDLLHLCTLRRMAVRKAAATKCWFEVCTQVPKDLCFPVDSFLRSNRLTSFLRVFGWQVWNSEDGTVINPKEHFKSGVSFSAGPKFYQGGRIHWIQPCLEVSVERPTPGRWDLQRNDQSVWVVLSTGTLWRSWGLQNGRPGCPHFWTLVPHSWLGLEGWLHGWWNPSHRNRAWNSPAQLCLMSLSRRCVSSQKALLISDASVTTPSYLKHCFTHKLFANGWGLKWSNAWFCRPMQT